MTSSAGTTTDVSTQASSGPIDLASLHGILARMAQTETDSGELLHKMLGLLVGLTAARGGATFQRRSEGSDLAMLHGIWPQDVGRMLPRLPDALKGAADEAVTSGRACVTKLDDLGGQIPTDRWVTITAPVLWQDRVFGAICLVLDLGAQGRPEPYLAVLQAVAACFQIHVLKRLGGAHQLLSQQMSVVLDAVARSVAARNATEMAFFMANELQQHLGCHQVAVGWRKRGDRAKVVAISGKANFNRRGDTARAIEAAMSEALRQERSVRFPPEETPGSVSVAAQTEATLDDDASGRPIDLAHEELLKICQTDLALTFPLRSGEDIVGAWTFQWRSDHLPGQADERLVSVATGQVGPVVDWARRADQGVIRRGIRSVGRAATALLGPRHLAAKGITAAVAVFLAVMIFVRVPFRVGGDCVLQPTPRRYMTARFDGVLKEANVRPGDIVKEGQLLAELEDYQLRDELGLARADFHEASKQADTLFAQGKLAEAQLKRIQAERAQAKIDLLEFKLKHVHLASPIDGVVLTGDLERARGIPVQRGQVLFEIAPLDEMVLEVAVPDADAAYVQPEQQGEFSLQARPEQTIDFAVKRIRPQAEVRDEKNTFVVEADVTNDEGWLRPGMEGTAKIGIDDRPIGWILTRDIVNWFRMTFWW